MLPLLKYNFIVGSVFLLGHGGRVMQICISKLTIIDSDNGLVSYIFISEKSFENVCKMSTILCWPQNVLIHSQCDGTFVYSVEYTSKIGIETCKMDNVFHPDNPRFGSGTECSWIRWSYVIIIHMYAYLSYIQTRRWYQDCFVQYPSPVCLSR